MNTPTPRAAVVPLAAEPDGVGTSYHKALVWRTTLWGVVLGSCFPLLATFVDLAWHRLPFTWSHVVAVQAGEPLHWIIDTAPLFLGLVAYAAGVYRARQTQHAAELVRLLKQRCDQLDSASADLARVDERHREAQERRRVLELAFEQARDGMALLDPDGNIVYANNALADMHGRSLADLLGRHTSYCFSAEEYTNRLTPFLRRVLGTGGSDTELTHQRSDGTTFPSLTSATSVTDAEGGQVGVVVYCRDIEQERETAQALRRSEQKLAGMIASMQEGIVYADEEGIVQTVNPYFCDFVGMKTEQIVGQRLEGFHTPELQARVDELIADARQDSKRIYSVERELDGRHVLFRIQPVSSGDGFLGMVMNIHDITEQRTARLAAEEASRAKSSFLASVSHEIRTPMNGVLGMTAMLLETELTEEQRMFASTVQDSAEALMSLINDVLDFSKMEAGKLTLQAQDFGWKRLLEGVRQILAPQAGQKQLQITCCGDPDLPPLLRGDESRLRQILLNLGGNAVKFTEGGGVALGAERLEETAEGVTVRFSVLDSGAGVAVYEQRRLFESFYQVDGSDTRQHGGSGLGLAISKQLVELMGGTIGLESGVGEGSFFWFTVTLARATSSATATATVTNDRGMSGSLMATMNGNQSRSGRILVVDDHQINRKVALALLERMGYEVLLASSGQQALTMTAEPFFDLVLMDLQMPGMDGLETTQSLRAQDHVARAGWPLPVVALTAHARVDDRDRCLAAGMDDYITKPFRKSELIQMLDRYLPVGASQPARVPIPAAPDAPVAIETRPAARPTARPAATPEPLPVFCHDDLLEMLGGNDALLPELLTILREDTGRMVEQLRQAIVDRSAQGVIDVGHTLKGVLGSVAGRAAAQTAKAIERLGGESAFDQAERELARLETQIAQLTDAIEDRIAQPVAQPA